MWLQIYIPTKHKQHLSKILCSYGLALCPGCPLPCVEKSTRINSIFPWRDGWTAAITIILHHNAACSASVLLLMDFSFHLSVLSKSLSGALTPAETLLESTTEWATLQLVVLKFKIQTNSASPFIISAKVMPPKLEHVKARARQNLSVFTAKFCNFCNCYNTKLLLYAFSFIHFPLHHNTLLHCSIFHCITIELRIWGL